jgi:hypothetical protein
MDKVAIIAVSTRRNSMRRAVTHLTNKFILSSFVAPDGAILNSMIGQMGVRPAKLAMWKLVSL